MNDYKFILTPAEKQLVDSVRTQFANKIENLVLVIDDALKEKAKARGVEINPDVIAYMIYTVVSDEVKSKIFMGKGN